MNAHVEEGCTPGRNLGILGQHEVAEGISGPSPIIEQLCRFSSPTERFCHRRLAAFRLVGQD